MNLQELRQWSDEVISAVEKYGIKRKDCTPNRELERAFLIREILDRLDAAEKVCRLANDFEQRRIDDGSPLVTGEEDALRLALKKWQGVE